MILIKLIMTSSRRALLSRIFIINNRVKVDARVRAAM